MAACPTKDLEEMAKAWSKAMEFSMVRFQRVHDLAEDQLDDAINAGHLVLENVCLFIYAGVKHGQFRPPLSFWQVLHSEYGIVVYPSAFQEDINIPGLGIDVTFTEAYQGHIMMHVGTRTKYPPRCPFEFIQEPPPVYQRETPKMET
ncbi:hypothetical protein NXS19_005318 [Fusarium pseudograminearum]|uniref:Uncharacterized protein n=1 Tax=Fusarium pseudograminearum (strain CS3096) TaxID=1028729 RepID=K3VGZ1_FUSPC|nr:hypothetical protein FPSE_06461 [Fusarium pseudograminearum CS3096]EKJ73389.1 hypothetical protein FPSE_06461 [Fusarium pseudograminearum CS3096]UZP37502.1 hypothetical protein NXS19_005318 [Fusarium pseudograminearum]